MWLLHVTRILDNASASDHGLNTDINSISIRLQALNIIRTGKCISDHQTCLSLIILLDTEVESSPGLGKCHHTGIRCATGQAEAAASPARSRKRGRSCIKLWGNIMLPQPACFDSPRANLDVDCARTLLLRRGPRIEGYPIPPSDTAAARRLQRPEWVNVTPLKMPLLDMSSA